MAQDSNTNYEQSFISQKFGSFFRINQFILKAKDNDDETDIFQKDYLKLIYELQVSFLKFIFLFKMNLYIQIIY